MTGYDAILLDNDGVIVEPPDRRRQIDAVRAAFAAVGVDDPDPGHVDALVSGVTPGTLRDVAAAYDLEPESLWAAREHHDERSQLRAFRNGERAVYDDVDAIAAFPGRVGVVSNNHHGTVAFVLAYFDLEGAVDVHLGRPKTVGSLERKKPDPNYLERALDVLDAEAALFVGDNASDVEAAHRAGIDSVFLRRPHARSVDLPVAPTYEVETLHGVADLLEN